MRCLPTAGLAALLIALAAPAAEARTCRAEPQPAAAPIAPTFWTDAAEFAFLVGRDRLGDQAAMTLAGRLRGLDNFAELRRSASDWDGLQARLVAVSARLEGLSAVVARLQGYCDSLDDIALDPGAPFDAAEWLAGVARLEAEIDTVIGGTRPVVTELQAYASHLRAAGAAYAAAGHAPVPEIRIGPDPASVAAGMDGLAGRWRALLADLQNARAVLPVTPEIGSERPLIAMTAAMTEILRATAEAQTLSATALGWDETRRILDGTYLYEQCPSLADGQWVEIESPYWTAKDGRPALLGHRILLDEQARATSGNAAVGLAVGTHLWQFNRIGLGYWLIRNAVMLPEVGALDVVNDSARGYPLTVTRSNGAMPAFTGQYWRCAPTSQAGQIRLYNLFLSEARAIDTYRNKAVAIMSRTGNFGAQFWRITATPAP